MNHWIRILTNHKLSAWLPRITLKNKGALMLSSLISALTTSLDSSTKSSRTTGKITTYQTRIGRSLSMFRSRSTNKFKMKSLDTRKPKFRSRSLKSPIRRNSVLNFRERVVPPFFSTTTQTNISSKWNFATIVHLMNEPKMVKPLSSDLEYHIVCL